MIKITSAQVFDQAKYLGIVMLQYLKGYTGIFMHLVQLNTGTIYKPPQASGNVVNVQGFNGGR